MISWGPLKGASAGHDLKTKLLAALFAALAALPLSARAAATDPPPPATYAEAVQRTLELVEGASPQDPVPARSALQVLVEGTGDTQPEIISDLRARPPLYDDASRRLEALLAALGQPVTTSDPALAGQRLHEVMSMSRYDALHRPPSVLDRLQQWVQDRINDLLRLLFGNRGGAQPPAIWFYAAGIAVLLAIGLLFASSARGRFKESTGLDAETPRRPADYFAEADRLAAAGDRVGAIRALCAAVAATLAGEGSWAGSPLTVREIFQRAPDYESLRPLLLPFEAAAYGGREVDRATYEGAARVAARFRQPVEATAA